MTALYQLRRLIQRYGDRTVLAVDQLDVALGEMLFLVGPTGAGKSTLLRLLAGLEPPSAGDLTFAEHRLNHASLPMAVQRRVTLVFQKPLLLHGSVRFNVEVGLRLRGARDRGAVQRVLDRLELARLADQYVRTLSGGETQLVALARALVFEPEVLLLDEPTAHLDPGRVALVEDVVAEAHKERGVTVIWATHNIFQAKRRAQRVGLLLNGQLVELAGATDFFAAPRDPRTAAFVRGEMVY